MRRLLLIIPLLAAGLAVTLAGCRTPGTYTYDQVKKEFAPTPPPQVAVSAPAPAPVAVVPGKPLTVDDAVEVALKNNPDLDMALSRIRQAEAMLDEARSTFWPLISLYGGYTQGDAPSAYLFKTIDQRHLGPQTDFNQPGWFQNYELGIRARWNLFNGGRDVLRMALAAGGVTISQLGRQAARNAVAASAIQTFYNALASREMIGIAQESIASFESQLRLMEVRLAGGAALRSDVLSLKVRIAQAREELVKAENNYRLTIAALANLLGLDPDTELELDGSRTSALDPPADYAAGLVLALGGRPELGQVREQLIQSRQALDLARSGYLPSVNAEAAAYLDDPHARFDWERKNWTVGVLVDWNIFSGLSTAAQEAKAKAAIKEMLELDRKTTLGVQLEVKSAYLKVAEARARLAATEASVAEAEESLQLVKKQYEGGAAAITRYLEAELARSMARMNRTAAVYDLQKSLADLARSVGRWAGEAPKKAGDK